LWFFGDLMKIGLIGFGSIGSYLAKNLKSEIVWVVDADPAVKQKMASVGLACGFHQLVPEKCEGADLVVEAASQPAVPLLLGCLAYCDVMILSVGALADEKLLREMKAAAEKYGRKIHLPSGAIGGIDAISAVCSQITSITLETSKPPSALSRDDKTRTVVFEGTATEACRLYPKNVNVSATLSLSGVGFEKTMVRIVSDPDAKANTHLIVVKSKAGNMRLEFENAPSDENPKTSALAALSALRTINRINGALQIG